MPIERRKLNAWDATVVVEDSGAEVDVPTVLVVHGEGGPASVASLVAALAPSYRVVLPTLPGFGGEPRVPGINRPRDLAYLCLDLLDSLGLTECAVVGSSLGAWIALEMAAMEPRRFFSVCLLGPVGVRFTGPTEPTFAELLIAAPERIAARLYADPAQDPGKAAADPDEVVRRLEHRESFMHYSWEPYLYEPTLRQLLPRITTPAMVLAGTEDGVPVAGYYESLAEALPAASLVRVDGAGHYPEIEQPARTAELVGEFVTKTVSDRAYSPVGRNGQQ